MIWDGEFDAIFAPSAARRNHGSNPLPRANFTAPDLPIERGVERLAGPRAEELCDGLGAVIDGVYLREALKSGTPDGKAAAAVALNYLKSHLKGVHL